MKLSFSTRETSREALALIQPHAKRIRDRILSHLRDCKENGATDEEIQNALDLSGDTERPQRCKLVAEFMVLDSESKRKTTKGRKAVVWVHADFDSPKAELN